MFTSSPWSACLLRSHRASSFHGPWYLPVVERAKISSIVVIIINVIIIIIIIGPGKSLLSRSSPSIIIIIFTWASWGDWLFGGCRRQCQRTSPEEEILQHAMPQQPVSVDHQAKVINGRELKPELQPALRAWWPRWSCSQGTIPENNIVIDVVIAIILVINNTNWTTSRTFS